MKFVSANKFYYLKGGAERYAFDLSRLLEDRGHEIAPFAMRDKKNFPSEWSRFFVSPVETERVSFSFSGLKTAGRFLYSFEARRKFGALLDAFGPDLVHVHNIYHQISPSILPIAHDRGLPVVMTVHDYKLIAPNYSLYHDGEICERTKPNRYWQAVRHRCVKGSMIAGALEAVEMRLHDALGLYRDNIDLYIAPSRFMMAKLIEYGVNETKIRHLPNFVDADRFTPSYGGDYAFFAGRLSPEKGVDLLIRAAAKIKDVPLRIAGTGPEEKRLKSLAAQLGADNVAFLGFLDTDKLKKAYAGARFVVIPSQWYENFGLVAMEAAACGKAVVATQLGGLPEMVQEGETGRLVSAGDISGLASTMWSLWADPATTEAMGRNARVLIEREYGPARHYEKIMAIYKEARK